MGCGGPRIVCAEGVVRSSAEIGGPPGGPCQVDAYLWLLLRHGDMAYYQYERGLLDDERLQSAIRPFTARLRYPLVQQEWESRKFAFAQGYQSFVDDIIATLP